MKFSPSVAKIIGIPTYANPNAVKLNACKYGIQGNQIRKWQNNTIALGDLLAYPTPLIVEE
jgi:hypothetical protein